MTAPSRWQFRLQVSSQPSLLAVEGISVEAAQAKITIGIIGFLLDRVMVVKGKGLFEQIAAKR